MNKRKLKKLFYKESAKWILNGGCTAAYINPRIVKQVVRKLEKLTKLKLIYYLYNKAEDDYFVIRKEEQSIISLPNGSIRKLIGKELSWNNELVKLKKNSYGK